MVVMFHYKPQIYLIFAGDSTLPPLNSTTAGVYNPQDMIKAVLFDMDGVLVDSEPFICEAAVTMFAEHGLSVKPEDFLPFVGTGEDNYIRGVAEKHGFTLDLERDKARTYVLYEEKTRERLKPLPGVHRFIEHCRALGLKTAVATSADKTKLDINLRALNVPPDTFNALVNGLEIKRKKPFPDIYLEAAGRLGVEASECLVVEDAVSGVKAARAAGAKCLGLLTSFSREAMQEADWISHSLEDAPEDAIKW